MKIFYAMMFFAYLVFTPTGHSAEHESSITVSVGMYLIEYQQYLHYLEGDVCQKLTPDFSVEQINRLIVDLMITCLAFKQQEIDLKINVIPYPNNLRAITMVEAGKIDAMAPVIALSDINEAYVEKSIPIIRENEFEKGIYFHENHPLLAQKNAEQHLPKYRGITMKAWHYDWAIIEQLTEKSIELRHLKSLFLMLASDRADFTLLVFPSLGDLAVTQAGITLKPLTGVKVVLPESRHFIVSKTSPNGAAYFKALNNGVKELRKQGTIKSLYLQSGFFNTKTKDWKVIGQPEVVPTVIESSTPTRTKTTQH